MLLRSMIKEVDYLTRHIYVDHNEWGSKLWGNENMGIFFRNSVIQYEISEI